MHFSEALIQMIIQEAPHLSLIPQNCYDWYIYVEEFPEISFSGDLSSSEQDNPRAMKPLSMA